MKKNPPKSKFDQVVDMLIEEFIKISNFDLVSTNTLANRAFNMITFRISEVISYKELVCQHFIPATNKAIFLSKRDFLDSRYNSLLNIKAGDFDETLYDTVRLAYVGLFHKIENFVNDLIRLSENLFEDP